MLVWNEFSASSQPFLLWFFSPTYCFSCRWSFFKKLCGQDSVRCHWEIPQLSPSLSQWWKAGAGVRKTLGLSSHPSQFWLLGINHRRWRHPWSSVSSSTKWGQQHALCRTVSPTSPCSEAVRMTGVHLAYRKCQMWTLALIAIAALSCLCADIVYMKDSCLSVSQMFERACWCFPQGCTWSSPDPQMLSPCQKREPGFLPLVLNMTCFLLWEPVHWACGLL